ncbi:hypothetical protein BDV11DRAFT_170443 [Aspergillus similis]
MESRFPESDHNDLTPAQQNSSSAGNSTLPRRTFGDTVDREHTFPPPAQRVTVQGPHVESESAPEHRDPLVAQLRTIPRGTTKLLIEEDPPSNTEWAILGGHFTNVRDLEIDSGFNEDLNDRDMPVHWPLERLVLSGVCGEVTKSPHILQGRIKHLILFFTMELRFEGPTSDELSRMNQEAIARGEAKMQYLNRRSDIQLINMSQLGKEWMAKKYNAPGLTENPQPEPETVPTGGEESRLRTLEIIENDALDAFLRMSAALPHLVATVTSLTLRSTSLGRDFAWFSERLFPKTLAQLHALETLNLSVGAVFKEPSTLSGLYANFPPNLTTLHLRGPIRLCRSERWEEWVSAFSNKSFLPRLERLAFVLDLYYMPDEYGHPELQTPPEEDLKEARAACERLYEMARRRGVIIESLRDDWAGKNILLRPVDDRW